MAESNSGNNENSGGGNGGERPRVGGETSRPPIVHQTIERATTSHGAEGLRTDGGNDGHAQVVIEEVDWRTPVQVERTLVGFLTRGPQVRLLDSRSGVEGLVVTGVGSVRAGSSGSGGGVSVVRPESLRRDLTKGKDPVAVEETPIEALIEPAEFIPPAGTSRSDPISKSDLAEFVGKDALARLMEESHAVVAIVIATREERLQQIALAEEEERIRREGKGLAREN